MFQRLGVRLSTAVSGFIAIMAFLGAFLIIANTDSNLDLLKQQGRWSSIIGARSVGSILEEIIDAGGLVRDDLFDSQFIPVENTSPQKYSTKYDALVSKALFPLENEYLQDKNIVYARVIDLNGYVPVRFEPGNTKETDDAQTAPGDHVGKQILMDDRITNVSLNEKKGFVQQYVDAQNRTIWEFSSPIFIKGERWGSFCVGYQNFPEQSGGAFFSPKQMLWGGLFTLLTVAVISFIILTALKPLSELLKMASDVADGNMDRPVKMKNRSEIGKLANVIERLRVSTKMAIDRLASNG